MGLPEYSDLHQKLHERGLEPLPAPDKRPTKKGLGRYLRDCYMANANDDVPRWQRRWFGCTVAYRDMLDLGVRLPSTTFWYDRLTVEADLMDPEGERGETAVRHQAMRWARSRP